jgi:thymidylate synthase
VNPPYVITLHSMREYKRLVRLVMDHGEDRSPRGLKTKDMSHVTIVLENSVRAMPMGTGRRLWTPIGAMEAIQLIAGRAMNPQLVTQIAPPFEQFMNGGSFHGAYGKRISNQMATVHDRLARDPDTRQAIVTLWDPNLDQLEGMRDYPCTVALRFSVATDGTLEMDTIMRSNDVWRGTPYDIFQFTQLQRTLARSLYREPGIYRHTTWSLHLYETDYEAADRFMDFSANEYTWEGHWQPDGIGHIGNTMQQMMVRARRIMVGDTPNNVTESEEWYLEQLSRRPTDVG